VSFPVAVAFIRLLDVHEGDPTRGEMRRTWIHSNQQVAKGLVWLGFTPDTRPFAES
jgi:hypothetical protein